MKSEIRNPKSEVNQKSEIRISLERRLRSFRLAGRPWPAFRISGFGFPSDLIGAAVALALVTFPALLQAAVPGGSFSVAHYGAKGDGTTLNTAAIQKTIDAAAAVGGVGVAGRAGGLRRGAGERIDHGTHHADAV